MRQVQSGALLGKGFRVGAGAIVFADCFATPSFKDSIPMNNLMRVHN